MRGYDRPQSTMLTLVNPEQRKPANRPIRLIKELAEVALKELSPADPSRCTVKWVGPHSAGAVAESFAFDGAVHGVYSTIKLFRTDKFRH